MAMLERRGDSFRVIFRYQGVRYARALGTRSVTAARGALARLEDNLHRAAIGLLDLPASGDLAEALLSDGHRSALPPRSTTSAPREAAAITLTALFSSYWATLPAGSLEETTIAGMKIHQRQLERYFHRDCLIESLMLSDLQAFVEHRSRDKGLHGRTVSATTIKKAIVTFRTVWNWGLQHGLVGKAFPSRGIRYPKGTEKPSFLTVAQVERRVRNASPAEAAALWECAFLSLDELDELLQVVRGRAAHSSVYPMFVFAAHTGTRRAEMIRSTLDDLDFDSGVVTIHERKRAHDRRTTRRVPMSPLLRDVLLELVDGHPGLTATFWHELPALRGHRPIAPQPLDADTAHHWFKRMLAGSRWENLRGWHVFRHSFCSNAAAAGIDQRVINGWVGHQTEEMVRRYRHLLPNQQQAAIAAMFGASEAAPAVTSSCVHCSQQS